jgi:hypothetical protein
MVQCGCRPPGQRLRRRGGVACVLLFDFYVGMAAQQQQHQGCSAVLDVVHWPETGLEGGSLPPLLDRLAMLRRPALISGMPLSASEMAVANQLGEGEGAAGSFRAFESDTSTLLYWRPRSGTGSAATMRAVLGAGGGGGPIISTTAAVLEVQTTLTQMLVVGRSRSQETKPGIGSRGGRYMYASLDPQRANISGGEGLLRGSAAAAGDDALWLASAGTRAQLHYDTHDNLFRQLSGVKVFRLVSPVVHRFDHFFPSFHPAQRHSQLLHGGSSDQELAQEEEEQDGAVVELRPGDALFLPAFILHEVTTPVRHRRA